MPVWPRSSCASGPIPKRGLTPFLSLHPNSASQPVWFPVCAVLQINSVNAGSPVSPRLEPPLQSRHRNQPEPYPSISPSSAEPARSSDPIDRFQHHWTISMPETELKSPTRSICLIHWEHPFPLSPIALPRRDSDLVKKSNIDIVGVHALILPCRNPDLVNKNKT